MKEHNLHIVERRDKKGHRHRKSIKVMSLNLAHGVYPFIPFRGKVGIRRILDGVVELVMEQMPDIVTFQEAEGRSIWTGRFHHLAYITNKAEFDYTILGEHMNRMLFSYGTAIMARTPLTRPGSTKFKLGRPCFPKGFVYGGIHLENFGDIDIASCHLDPMSRKSRMKQADIICNVLERRERPLVLTGDFNCTWSRKNSVLRTIADRLSLEVFMPELDMPSHKATGKRLDWILISRGLEFIDYRHIDTGLSDHMPVIAEIGAG